MKLKQTLITLGIIVPLVAVFFLFVLSVNSENEETGTEDSETLVLLETSKGDITIKLYTKQAPITTSNFKKLVEEGFYDGIKFHRVIPNFMVQVGDPLTKDDSKKAEWGSGGPGYTIEDEFVEGLSNTRGTLSMANTGRPNSGGSQFFINVADNSFLDYDKEPLSSKHPVFGEVIEGMEVVDEIVSAQRDANDLPREDIIILKASVISH